MIDLLLNKQLKQQKNSEQNNIWEIDSFGKQKQTATIQFERFFCRQNQEIKKRTKQVSVPFLVLFNFKILIIKAYCGDYRTRTGHLDTASVAL